MDALIPERGGQASQAVAAAATLPSGAAGLLPNLPAEALPRPPAATRTSAFTWRRSLAVLAAALWLLLLWHLPNQPEDLHPGFFNGLALEVVLLLLALAALPALRRGQAGRVLRHGVAVSTLLVVLLCLADYGMREALARPLTPLLDIRLGGAVLELLGGAIGEAGVWLALIGFGALLAIAYGLSLQAAAALQRGLEERPLRRVVLALGLTLLLVQLGPTRLVLGMPQRGQPLVEAHASGIVWEQGQHSWRMVQAIGQFTEAASIDPFADVPPAELVAGLHGADVVVAFFESYGRSALEQPRYADLVKPALARVEQVLAAKGLHAASGYLTSPTLGGQSWLAHGTLESGLWLEHQAYYDSYLTSSRLSLTKAFAGAGYRTVTVQPALTKAWPEGTSLGFEQVYGAADLGYAGKPYDWVTMPDQYSFAAFEQRERTGRAGRRPVFAELALISSHAPWTQLPQAVVDWDQIGDGALFSQWAGLGEPASVLWQDPERVRQHYARSLDYVIQVVGAYAARYVDDQTVLIVLGDHQPAPMMTGPDAGRDVPIHVIAGDPKLLRPFLDWGMTAGLQPADRPALARMDGFRDWFFRAFSRPGAVIP